MAGPSWDHDPARRLEVTGLAGRTPLASRAMWDWLCGGGGERGESSRRRDCHFADNPSPSILKHLLKREGGCSRMTVSPTPRRELLPR